MEEDESAGGERYSWSRRECAYEAGLDIRSSEGRHEEFEVGRL